MFVALGIAGAIVVGWRWHRIDALRRQVPPLPALAGKPAELQARLRAADMDVRANPASPQRWADLGGLYQANNYLVPAKQCWLRLAGLQPAEPRWAYYLADIAATESDEAAVARELQRTVQLAPDYAPAWLKLGDFAFKRGDFPGAERAYRRRLALAPGDPYARLGLARLALQRGDRSAAKQELTALLRDHGDFASAHDLYAELAEADGDRETAKRQRWFGVAAGRYRSAADPWNEALRSSCFDVDQLLIWGDVDLQTKYGDHGKAWFERAVKLAPESSAAWQKMGEFELDAKDTAKALEAFVRAWRLPNPSEVLGNELNDACLALGRNAEALAFMDEGLRRLPDSSVLHNARGVDLAALGRIDEAMAAFRVAIAKSANNPAPRANLGLALLQRGDKARARHFLDQALAVQPGFPKALAAEARLALQDRDFDAAARLVLPYFEQYPGVREARTLMAEFYLAKALDADRRGDPQAAEEVCRAGLAAVPEAARLHQFLGLQFLQRGDFARATGELETAHRDDPADAKGTTLLAKVYVEQRRLADARELLRIATADAERQGDKAKAAYLSRFAVALPASE